ncbi:hypothetical protein EJ02DRAFT_422523 [Clathrospora elynae]|uniref:Uncharacterized protein n=1 Tax=Clathrospora elynae TaxID=706981 RepID=A0A6A5STQ9_9PLEO|nr:hypothetical protein EJ02DRAFT_422523 [Clathrospora elynae]
MATNGTNGGQRTASPDSVRLQEFNQELEIRHRILAEFNKELEIRHQILVGYHSWRTQSSSTNPPQPIFISGNGNLEMDTYLAWHVYGENRSTDLLVTVNKIYGLSNPVTGSGEIPNPISGSDAYTPPPHPWGLLAQHAGTSSEYFVSLIDDALEKHDARREHPPEINSSLMRNDDMMVILNARGTVLLNMMFNNTPQQKSIVKLASLASTMWRRNTVPITDHFVPKGPEGRTFKDAREANHSAVRMISHIREDIQKHMKEAIEGFSAVYKKTQEDSINIFKERVETFKTMRNMRSMSEPHEPEDKRLDISYQFHENRRKFEDILLSSDQAITSMLRSLHPRADWDFVLGSHYLGPPLDDAIKQEPARDDLYRWWFATRRSGYWFNV